MIGLMIQIYKKEEKRRSKYGFNQEQREYLDELLSDENNSLLKLFDWGHPLAYVDENG